eukprot:10119185-Lingulodinium_polyedra.AAC.1
MPGMLCKCTRCNGHLVLYNGPMRRVERPENWNSAQAAWLKSRGNPAADPEFQRCPFEPGGARDILE